MIPDLTTGRRAPPSLPPPPAAAHGRPPPAIAASAAGCRRPRCLRQAPPLAQAQLLVQRIWSLRASTFSAAGLPATAASHSAPARRVLSSTVCASRMAAAVKAGAAGCASTCGGRRRACQPWLKESAALPQRRYEQCLQYHPKSASCHAPAPTAPAPSLPHTHGGLPCEAI